MCFDEVQLVLASVKSMIVAVVNCCKMVQTVMSDASVIIQSEMSLSVWECDGNKALARASLILTNALDTCVVHYKLLLNNLRRE